MNINYLEKLYKTSREGVVIDSNFSFSVLDTVNAYLVRKALSNDFNLWIDVNKRDIDALYRPIVFESLIKFFKVNYDNANKTPPKVGEKYHKSNKRYEVIETGFYIRGSEAVKLKCISRGQDNTLSRPLDYFYTDYIKLDDESGSSNRGTFKPMMDFVNQAIGVKYSFQSFNNKFAIVCSKKHFEKSFTLKERKAFPYEYITKNEETQPNLPLEDFMFYVAPDYETIEDFVIDSDIDLDLVIFFSSKENLQIQQNINRGSIKEVFFIGNQKPDIDNLLKWKWTLPEFQYFDERIDKTTVNTVVVNNEDLNAITFKFLNYIKGIEDKYGINLRPIYLYISYLYPIVIPSEDSRLGNSLEDIAYRFEKKLEQVLTQEFSVIGIDHEETRIELLDIYRDALFQVDFVNNAKSMELSKLEETEYLLTPSRQTLEVWKHEIRNINWQKVKVISLSKFKELTEQSSVTVLALEDRELFQEVYSGIHNIQWLLYDNEYENYKKFKDKYDNELIEEFRSKDRKKLSGIDYPDEPKVETTESLIDRIFDKNISDIGREYESSYHDHIFKEIVFFDSTSIIRSASSGVILINENNKPINNKVGDLMVGDKVRIYENQHKDVLLNSIIQSDEHGKFQRILDDSERWKNILKAYCSNDIKIQDLALRCGIAPSTVKGWFKLDSNTKFPQSLDKVRDLLGQDYPQIYKSSKNYKSITIAVGRDLSDEISNYIIKGAKGSLLSKLNNDIINLISQQNMPIRKIKSIAIVETEAS
ncbi:MAG TPA: hypothetical protein EYQ45_07590 [Flavobacteriaceae bacterium]|nr:hypothetical protein [Flavobacteriaceae bacterium]